ncbi:PA4780 family RIO1-like protein kinase [Pseudohongiella sp.]|uniref:non-specific serine/threonine protein kinase n=1 Tax=marine sediment metagenome TaxID=412755 RepID=A0A0F9VZW3_9ZZZZ|nr:PA4780 family RIO1-like protein kinase [Pseudohongiella sp.]HDZ09803.1 serine protein kinase RIO [Pseudohongiella sp.]HEA61583.1 serine protein kinase RIO [Pseudohongiella sp.]
MKTPARLQPLMDDGLIDEVVSQLMSGKEAQVYVVRCGSKLRCAKIYKEANNRSFKQAATYQEGRKVRNSRDARAMGRRSKYGQRGHEEAWLNAEVDALRRLHLANVRVPRTHGFVDGVLLMDMIVDAEGDVAPRLNDVELTHEQALLHHARIMDDVVKMLSAGLIHGDLSEFNVLLADDGPVIIDLPQAVNAAGNNNAASMLIRDVENMTRYFGRFAPELLNTYYGPEIWDLYERGRLRPGVVLTGQFERRAENANIDEILMVIEHARAEAQEAEERRLAAESGDDE